MLHRQLQRFASSILPSQNGIQSYQKQSIARLHIVKSVKEMMVYRDQLALKDPTKSIGFVPTMGALHTGHLDLVKVAKKNNDLTVVSIFVNPKQFSPGEDLNKYPRPLEQDIKLLTQEGVDILFLPTEPDMYPTNSLCHVEPTAFSQIEEGLARPDFFRGVATIVLKLFNIVLPTKVYFGQKDISQCILLKQMIEDFHLRIQMNIVETIRDPNHGLALSSRNTYLTKEEYQRADILYKALSAGKQFIQTNTSSSVSRQAVTDEINRILKQEPMVSRVEYISLASHHNMKELQDIDTKEGCVLSSAIRLGNVRLIDNLLVGQAHTDILGTQ